MVLLKRDIEEYLMVVKPDNLPFYDAENNSLTYLTASSIYGKSTFSLWVMIPYLKAGFNKSSLSLSL